MKPPQGGEKAAGFPSKFNTGLIPGIVLDMPLVHVILTDGNRHVQVKGGRTPDGGETSRHSKPLTGVNALYPSGHTNLVTRAIGVSHISHNYMGFDEVLDLTGAVYLLLCLKSIDRISIERYNQHLQQSAIREVSAASSTIPATIRNPPHVFHEHPCGAFMSSRAIDRWPIVWAILKVAVNQEK